MSLSPSSSLSLRVRTRARVGALKIEFNFVFGFALEHPGGRSRTPPANVPGETPDAARRARRAPRYHSRGRKIEGVVAGRDRRAGFRRNEKVGGETKTWDECNGSSARLGVRGRARVRVLESEVEDGFESKFEFEFESSRSSSSSSCRVRVRVRGPEFELPSSSSRLS